MAATTAGDSRLALLSQRCQRNPEAARARVAGHIETPYSPTTGDDVDVARPERYSFPQTPWLVDCQPTRVDARDKRRSSSSPSSLEARDHTRRQLERTLLPCVEHYNGHPPHPTLGLAPPG